MERKERMTPEFKINEPGIVIGESLYLVSERSWGKNQANYLNKISYLLKVLRPENFTRVFFDILWNEEIKRIIIKSDNSEYFYKGIITEI